MNDFEYATWRFMYWSRVGNMTYKEIDQAVSEGRIRPGEVPKKEEKFEKESKK